MSLFYYLVIFQALMIGCCCLFSVIIIKEKANNLTKLLLCVGLLALVQNAGYLLEILATEEVQAMTATRVEYIGGAFLVTCLFAFIVQYCRIQFPKGILSILFSWDTLIAILVWTYPAQHLYYRNVHFVEGRLFPHLVFERGILYYIFMLIMLVQMVAGLILTIVAGKRERELTRKKSCYALGAAMVIPVGMFVLGLLGVGQGFDPAPAGVAIGTTFFAIHSVKNHLFDVTEVAHQNIIHTMKEPILIVDIMFDFLEANQEAYDLFPELREYRVGQPMDKFCLASYFKEGNQQEYQTKDKAYYVNVTRIEDSKVSVGYLIMLVDVTVERTKQLAKQAERVKLMSLQAVQALVSAVDAKDDYTKGHSGRVAEYSVMLAEELPMEASEIENLRYAALLHDVGKIGVPDHILNKPMKLTDIEYEIIQSHTVLGGNILKTITSIDGVKEIARHHHERYDGKGYPDGLKGERIPYLARIVGIADAYDAMSSNRVYREALPDDRIREELARGRGTQFDPELLDVFLKLFDEGRLREVRQLSSEATTIYYDNSDRPLVHDEEELKMFAGKLRRLESHAGAMSAQFEDFGTFFEYLLNLSNRYGHKVQLAMITLKSPGEDEKYSKDMKRAMQYMEGVIRISIRSVDVYSRYSDNQFFIIFIDAGEENVQMIMERIFRNYYKTMGVTDIQPEYSVTQVE